MSFGAYIVDDETELYDDEDYGYDLGFLGKNKPKKKPKPTLKPKSTKTKTKTRPRIVPIGRSTPLPADTPPIFETGNTTKIDVQNTPPIIPNIEINNNSTTKGGGSWLDKVLREGRSMFDQYVGGGRRQEIDAGSNIIRSSGGGRREVDASIGAGLDFDANEQGLGIGGKVNISTWLMIGGGALFLVFLLGMMRKSKSR